jgi:hypothetical protein
MELASTRRGACARVAMLAVALVLAWSAARVHFMNGGNWTALFCVGAIVPMPAELDAGIYRVADGGYDGQFYRLLAHDPFLTKGFARYADAPRFRFRRCLVPIAAWLLALGQQRWIDGAYNAVEMMFLALGTYWCARLFVRHGCSALWGFLFLAMPAPLASFDRMLLDGPLTALFAGFLLYSEEEKGNRVWLLAMLAGLTRETGLLLAAALVADRVFRRDWRAAAGFAACAAPALAWFAYVAARLPAGGPVDELGTPVWSLLRQLLVFRPYPDPVGQAVLRITDFLAVAGLAAGVVLAVLWLRKCRLEPVPICVGLYACLALVLGPKVMVEAFSFGRVVSPLLLWIAMEAVVRKKWAALAPPFLVSLNVSLVFAKPLVTIGQALLGR